MFNRKISTKFNVPKVTIVIILKLFGVFGGMQCQFTLVTLQIMALKQDDNKDSD
jgi:hypothetical protein